MTPVRIGIGVDTRLRLRLRAPGGGLADLSGVASLLVQLRTRATSSEILATGTAEVVSPAATSGEIDLLWPAAETMGLLAGGCVFDVRLTTEDGEVYALPAPPQGPIPAELYLPVSRPS